MFAQYDDFDFVPCCHVSTRRAIRDCDLSPLIIDSGLEPPTGGPADVSRPPATKYLESRAYQGRLASTYLHCSKVRIGKPLGTEHGRIGQSGFGAARLSSSRNDAPAN